MVEVNPRWISPSFGSIISRYIFSRHLEFTFTKFKDLNASVVVAYSLVKPTKWQKANLCSICSIFISGTAHIVSVSLSCAKQTEENVTIATDNVYSIRYRNFSATCHLFTKFRSTPLWHKTNQTSLASNQWRSQPTTFGGPKTLGDQNVCHYSVRRGR